MTARVASSTSRPAPNFPSFFLSHARSTRAKTNVPDNVDGTAWSRALALALISLSLTGCAVASLGDGPTMGPGHISETQRIFAMAAGTWDINRDGQVTCAEWQGYLAELVASADKSRDGVLDEEEFATIVRTDRLFATANFAFWDADSDGKIIPAEMIERDNPAFAILDRDKDCVLTATELSAARLLQHPPNGPGGPPGGRPGGGPGGGPSGGGGPGGM